MFLEWMDFWCIAFIEFDDIEYFLAVFVANIFLFCCDVDVEFALKLIDSEFGNRNCDKLVLWFELLEFVDSVDGKNEFLVLFKFLETVEFDDGKAEKLVIWFDPIEFDDSDEEKS